MLLFSYSNLKLHIISTEKMQDNILKGFSVSPSVSRNTLIYSFINYVNTFDVKYEV